MRYFVFAVISFFTYQIHATEASKSSTVLNHLMTVGRNDAGFEKLPDKLLLNGWSFTKDSDQFYYVEGPLNSLSKRKYEYSIKNNDVDYIAMTGGHTQRILYRRDACLEVYKESLQIKADESLLDSTLDIFKKYKVEGPVRDLNDKSYGRLYAKNCKLIFNLDQETVLNQMYPKTRTNK